MPNELGLPDTHTHTLIGTHIHKLGGAHTEGHTHTLSGTQTWRYTHTHSWPHNVAVHTHTHTWGHTHTRAELSLSGGELVLSKHQPCQRGTWPRAGALPCRSMAGLTVPRRNAVVRRVWRHRCSALGEVMAVWERSSPPGQAAYTMPLPLTHF